MSRYSRTYRIFIAVIALAGLMAGIAAATPVSTGINYQGRLTDSAGIPLTGTYTVTFGLYDVSSGGAPLATEVQSVQVSQGIFSTTLNFNPGLINGQALWLGIQVNTDPEMLPRQPFQPVPYALYALNPTVPQNLVDLSGNLSTTGGTAFNNNFDYTGTCVLGDIILSVNGYGGTDASNNALPADGRLLTISGNTALFSILGTTFGGDGVTSFGLPDLRAFAPKNLEYNICVKGIFPPRS
jgi:Phage Tail Collar Domain